jgi:hypothetical protein
MSSKTDLKRFKSSGGGKTRRFPLAAFGPASAMDEVEYQSYLAIAVCLDAMQEQRRSRRTRLRRVPGGPARGRMPCRELPDRGQSPQGVANAAAPINLICGPAQARG